MLKKRFAKEMETLSAVHNEYTLDIGDIALGIGVGFGKPPKALNHIPNIDVHADTGLLFDPRRKLNKRQPFMYIDINNNNV